MLVSFFLSSLFSSSSFCDCEWQLILKASFVTLIYSYKPFILLSNLKKSTLKRFLDLFMAHILATLEYPKYMLLI